MKSQAIFDDPLTFVSTVAVKETSGSTKIAAKTEVFHYPIGVIYFDRNVDTDSCRIVNLSVDNVYRGQGVGVKLVRSAEKQMYESGCKCIEGSAVPESRDFWHKIGYEVLDNGEIRKCRD